MSTVERQNMLIDLHTHTRPKSPCSNLDPRDLIQSAREAGLDAICLTEHNYVWTLDELAELGELHGCVVLRGMEVTASWGHILVFGLEEYASGMLNAKVLRKMVTESGGYMILAHPGRSGISDGPPLDLVDAVEVCNGANTRHEQDNTAAFELCERFVLPGVGGSDAHFLRDIGSCATTFERPIANERELVAELKAGRFRPTDLRQEGTARGHQ